MVQITVSWKGHPEPAVSWQREGDVLVSGDHYQVLHHFLVAIYKSVTCALLVDHGCWQHIITVYSEIIKN